MTRRWRCTVCGYVHEGPDAPDACPVCGVGSDAFVLDDEPPAPVPVPVPVATAPAPGAALPAGPAGPRWIVVGGGVAGLCAVEAAREAHPDARLVLVHREASLPYDRLSLTRVLAGEVSADALTIRPRGWFDERRIELVNAEVREIDRAGRRVLLGDGRALAWDRLLLATGAHAFVPPVPGVAREGVHVLRTLADAQALLARTRPGARAVCIGGGLLGLETAGGLARRGLAVTVLEEAPWLLSRQLARSAADRLAARLADERIAVRTGVKVKEIAGDETVRAVLLADGAELPADLVVLAAGVRPNAALARAAGLATARGVLVDDALRTSDPDVLAAGDVAEHRGVVAGLWVVAQEQGRLAGRALAGEPASYAGQPPPASLKVLSLPVFSIGRFEPETPHDVVLERATGAALLRVVVRDGAVLGGNLVGDAALAGALRRAAREGLRLDDVPELAQALRSRSP